MENSHKILIGLVAVTLLLTAGNFAVLVGGTSVEVADQGRSQSTDADALTGEDSRTYSTYLSTELDTLSFEYPDGWHMYTRKVFDNSARIKPEHEIYLDKNPISFSSPSGGPSMVSQVTMIALDEGEAIFAPYEGVTWKEYLTDEVTINGKKAMRLQITAPEDMAYISPYTEVLIIGGYEIRYEAASKQEAAADPSWALIKNSIKIK